MLNCFKYFPIYNLGQNILKIRQEKFVVQPSLYLIVLNIFKHITWGKCSTKFRQEKYLNYVKMTQYSQKIFKLSQVFECQNDKMFINILSYINCQNVSTPPSCTN